MTQDPLITRVQLLYPPSYPGFKKIKVNVILHETHREWRVGGLVFEEPSDHCNFFATLLTAYGDRLESPFRTIPDIAASPRLRLDINKEADRNQYWVKFMFPNLNAKAGVWRSAGHLSVHYCLAREFVDDLQRGAGLLLLPIAISGQLPHRPLTQSSK